MIKSKVESNKMVSKPWSNLGFMQGGYQSKMKDRVQYPTEKKKKQQQAVEDKKKDKDVNLENGDNIINGAKINGGLLNGQNHQSSLSNESLKGLCKLIHLRCKSGPFKVMNSISGAWQKMFILKSNLFYDLISL